MKKFQKLGDFFRGWIQDQWLFKLISLIVALILWMTVLGRRDFVLTKIISVEFSTLSEHRVVGQTSDRLRVRVSGPRTQIKKFVESERSQSIIIDISNLGLGVHNVDVPASKIEIPSGVRILGLKPNVIQVEVSESGK